MLLTAEEAKKQEYLSRYDKLLRGDLAITLLRDMFTDNGVITNSDEWEWTYEKAVELANDAGN